MQLRTVNGELTLGSVWRLSSWGLLIGFGIFMAPIFLIILIGATLSGQISDNGHMVYGQGPVFMVLLPMIVLMPIALVWNAFWFGGLVALGLRIYRHWRPLTVTAE